MFDKDMMFLMVFGLRGLKHEDEAQNALLCANQLKEHLNDVNFTTVSVGVTSGQISFSWSFGANYYPKLIKYLYVYIIIHTKTHLLIIVFKKSVQ